jgi:hypothetical protein
MREDLFDLGRGDAIAMGREYRGRRVKQATVVYVACEGERGLAARAEAYRRECVAEDSGPVPFYLLTTRLDLAADTPELIENIQEQLGAERCGGVVVDTLNRSLVGSESSDEDMAGYVKAVDRIREAFGCVVVVIHHCGHDGSRPRGHSSLGGDAQIAVKQDAAGLICATLEFAKDGSDGDEILSRLKVVELDEDEDGDSISSCVIQAADDGYGGKPATGKTATLTPQNRIALDMLRRAIAERGEEPPFNTHIPAGFRAVKSETWRAFCYAGTVTKSEKEDAKQKAFKRAADALQASSVIAVWSDWVWLTKDRRTGPDTGQPDTP